jgi:hypothetical protein
MARSVQFPVSLGILGQARVVFGAQLCRRPAREAACALLCCDLPDHVRQSALRPTSYRDTDRHSHGARWQSRLMYQSQLTVRVQRGLDCFFNNIHRESSFHPS